MHARRMSEKLIARLIRRITPCFSCKARAFCEVLRIPGLSERVQQESRMVIAGPTTLAALISSLQLGFKSLAIEQRTQEVMNLLGAIRTDLRVSPLCSGAHRKSSGSDGGAGSCAAAYADHRQAPFPTQRLAGERGEKTAWPDPMTTRKTSGIEAARRTREKRTKNNARNAQRLKICAKTRLNDAIQSGLCALSCQAIPSIRGEKRQRSAP